MPSPFPGMDPWIEHPALWPDVHVGLINALRVSLGPVLRPRYYVAVGIHSYIVTPPTIPPRLRLPDVMIVDTPYWAPAAVPAAAPIGEPIAVSVPAPEEVEESYLEVREVASGDVITAIEILSPTNKQPGEGRKQYEAKRAEILRTYTHLVEIDLLRDWPPMPFEGNAGPSHYRFLIRRGERRSQADLYPFTVRDAIPRFPLPLQRGDVEPVVDLKPLLDELYDDASYDLRVDYAKPPVPPLSDADAEWAELLASKRPTPDT